MSNYYIEIQNKFLINQGGMYMNFTANELFLLALLLIACIIIGGLCYFSFLKSKETKLINIKFKENLIFISKILNNIAVRENINIDKYVDMTYAQLNNMKGDEFDE